MSSTPVMGLCLFSIDVSGAPRSEVGLVDLCRQFAAADVPVTWSLAEVPGDEFRRAIDESGAEVAVLAEPSWAAEGSSRSLFCDGLARRLTTLRSTGLRPTTVSLPNGRLAAHDDVLVKNGVRAVRAAVKRQQPRAERWWRRNKSDAKPISPLRWGLWELLVNLDLNLTGLAGAARSVDRITRQGGVAVMAADATTLERDVKRLPRLLDHLKRRRDEKRLTIETVVASLARQHVPRQTPARSILRTAAA